MRDLPRLFIETEIKENSEIVLFGNQMHYLCNVMRLKTGDSFEVFDGKNGQWQAKITEIQKREIKIIPFRKNREQSELRNIRLYFSPIKGHRNDNIIEKATELGIKQISPIITNRTIVRNINIEKYRALAIEACEQCQGLNIPQIDNAQSLESVLQNNDCDLLLFCDEEMNGKNISEISKIDAKSIGVLIGPEGGFDDKERKLISQNRNIFTLKLGPRILRADTAVISALSLLQNYWGDWR